MTNNKLKYYLEVIESHKKTLKRTRNILERLLDAAEENISYLLQEDKSQHLNQPKICETMSKSDLNLLFGNKESAASTVIKLANILLKLIPVELEVAKADLSKSDIEELDIIEQTTIPEDDMEIVRNYFEKWSKEQGLVSGAI